MVGQRDFGSAGDGLLVAVDTGDNVRFAWQFGGPKEDTFDAVLPLADGAFAIGKTFSYNDLYALWGVRTNVTGNATVQGATRTALSLAFDPPGALRAGSTDPTDRLDELVDAAFSPVRSPITFAPVDDSGDPFANDAVVIATKR